MKNQFATNMLNGQLITSDVLDETILEAMHVIKREEFVPENLRGVAYIDEEVPLGEGRFLMEPLVLGRMLKYAAITPSMRVLDVAGGMGYVAAVLSLLADKVVCVEENPALFAKAKQHLAPYSKVELVQNALVEGYTASAPYDVVIIEGAIQIEPALLLEQLKEDGKLFAVEQISGEKVSYSGLGKLVQFHKVKGTIHKTLLHDASSHLLPAFKKSPAFVF